MVSAVWCTTTALTTPPGRYPGASGLIDSPAPHSALEVMVGVGTEGIVVLGEGVGVWDGVGFHLSDGEGEPDGLLLDAVVVGADPLTDGAGSAGHLPRVWESR